MQRVTPVVSGTMRIKEGTVPIHHTALTPLIVHIPLIHHTALTPLIVRIPLIPLIHHTAPIPHIPLIHHTALTPLIVRIHHTRMLMSEILAVEMEMQVETADQVEMPEIAEVEEIAEEIAEEMEDSQILKRCLLGAFFAAKISVGRGFLKKEILSLDFMKKKCTFGDENTRFHRARGSIKNRFF